MGWVHKIGLQQRIMLYVTLGLLSLVALFAVIALRVINASDDAILQERLVLAQTVARNVDSRIETSLSLLDSTASLLLNGPLDEPSSHEKAMLQSMTQELGDHLSSLGSPVNVVLVESNGAPIWQGTTEQLSGIPVSFPVSQTQRIIANEASMIKTFTQLDGPFPTLIVLGVPVASPNGEAFGALIAALPPDPADSVLYVPGEDDRDSYRLEVIDESGIVVGSSDNQHVWETSRHMSINGTQLYAGIQGVWKHESMTADVEDHIVALVPLDSIPWAVALEQDEDVALALPGSLTRRLYLLAMLIIPAGLILAWITTRQVVRPITRLTQTAGNIASGDLESPVNIAGQDEVRTLARSFEVMRVRLKKSLDDIASWNQRLESRVQSRTRELEKRNEERTQLLKKVITAQEDERKRVARDLHDMVGQSLLGIGMALGNAESEVENDPRTVRERLGALRTITNGTIEDVRRLIADLRPSLLDDLGLTHAVGWYTETYLEKSGIATTIEASGSDANIPSHVETAVFRVMQESITNVIKHSQARNVAIVLQFTESSIAGEVRDDGVGFDNNGVRRGAVDRLAVGVLGMEERASLLGGDLTVTSEPGEGTSVVFHIPLEKPEDA